MSEETHEQQPETRLRRSDQIGELGKALAKARSEMPPIGKNAQGQKGKQTYKYADLAKIYGDVIEPLSNHDIAHMQFPTYEHGKFVVTTLLVHGESGQWIESECAFAYNTKGEYASDPKEQGLTITYIRRYAFIAAIGVIPGGEDDENKLGNNQSNQRRAFEADKAKGGNNQAEPNHRLERAKEHVKKQLEQLVDEQQVDQDFVFYYEQNGEDIDAWTETYRDLKKQLEKKEPTNAE